MSGAEVPVPASVSLGRSTHKEIGQMAAAMIEVWDAVCVIGDAVGAQLAQGEGLAWARERAGAESRQESVDRVLASIAESRTAARRQAAAPSVNVRRDGSRLRRPDPGWEAVERDAFLAARDGQAAKHAAMATAGRAPADVGDAHSATRKLREQIYAEYAKKGTDIQGSPERALC